MKKLSILVFLAVACFAPPSQAAPPLNEIEQLQQLSEWQKKMIRVMIAQGYSEGLIKGLEYCPGGKPFDKKFEVNRALEIADEIMADSPLKK